jgi:hypothetical protein
MKRLIKALVAMCAMSMASGVSATVILNEVGGTLLGASNVQVGDFLYDVNFVDGSCAGLFDGCDDASDFDFQTLDDAVAAGFALLDQVFVGRFDTDYFDTNGCDVNSNALCQSLIPFALGAVVPTVYPSADFSLVNVRNSSSIPDLTELAPLQGAIPNAPNDYLMTDATFKDLVYSPEGNDCNELCENQVTYARFMVTGTVPEPTTTALLALGLFGVGAAARRRKLN